MKKIKIILLVFLLSVFCYAKEFSLKNIKDSFQEYGINEVKIEKLNLNSIEIKIFDKKKEQYPIHKRKVFTKSILLDNTNGNLDFFIILVEILENLKLDYEDIYVKRYCDKVFVGEWTIKKKTQEKYTIKGSCIEEEGNFINWKKDGSWKYDGGYLFYSNGKLKEEQLYDAHIIYDDKERIVEEREFGVYKKYKRDEKGNIIYEKEVKETVLNKNIFFFFKETKIDGKNKQIITVDEISENFTKSYWSDETKIAQFHYKGIKKKNGRDFYLILDGTQYIYYSNGNIMVESRYKKGKLFGKQVKYYENGNIQEEFYYVDGRLDGHHIKNDNLGNIIKDDLYLYQTSKIKGKATYILKGENEFKKNYENGELDGISEFTFKNKGIHLICNYKKGLLNGIWKLTDLEGRVILESNYLMGKLDGARKFYYKNGKVAQKSEYQDGKLVGNIIYYNSEGKKIGKKFINKKDILKEINSIGENIYLKIILKGSLLILFCIFIYKKIKERQYLLEEIEKE